MIGVLILFSIPFVVMATFIGCLASRLFVRPWLASLAGGLIGVAILVISFSAAIYLPAGGRGPGRENLISVGTWTSMLSIPTFLFSASISWDLSHHRDQS